MLAKFGQNHLHPKRCAGGGTRRRSRNTNRHAMPGIKHIDIPRTLRGNHVTKDFNLSFDFGLVTRIRRVRECPFRLPSCCFTSNHCSRCGCQCTTLAHALTQHDGIVDRGVPECTITPPCGEFRVPNIRSQKHIDILGVVPNCHCARTKTSKDERTINRGGVFEFVKHASRFRNPILLLVRRRPKQACCRHLRVARIRRMLRPERVMEMLHRRCGKRILITVPATIFIMRSTFTHLAIK